MPKTFAAILFLAFMVQSFSRGFYYIDYYANTSAYAKNCENKARPAMHCNGKCQMMKKILAQEKKEQEESSRKSEVKIEVLSSKSFYLVINNLTFKVASHSFILQNSGAPIDQPSFFFHPPGC